MSAALWTTKYAPTSVDKIVGQSGAASNAKKLQVRQAAVPCLGGDGRVRCG